jgi:hypothetical protein
MDYSAFSMRVRMSSTFHAVVRGPSFIGFGKRPVLIPAHQVERPTGIGPLGASIEGRRTNPVLGRVSFVCSGTLFEIEIFISTLFVRERGEGGDVFLEIVAARVRVDPLLAERGIKTRESRTACRRAALFASMATRVTTSRTLPRRLRPHKA